MCGFSRTGFVRIRAIGFAFLFIATLVHSHPELGRALANGEEGSVPVSAIRADIIRRRQTGVETAASFRPNRKLHQAIVNTSDVTTATAQETEPVGTPLPDPDITPQIATEASYEASATFQETTAGSFQPAATATPEPTKFTLGMAMTLSGMTEADWTVAAETAFIEAVAALFGKVAADVKVISTSAVRRRRTRRLLQSSGLKVDYQVYGFDSTEAVLAAKKDAEGKTADLVTTLQGNDAFKGKLTGIELPAPPVEVNLTETSMTDESNSTAANATVEMGPQTTTPFISESVSANVGGAVVSANVSGENSSMVEEPHARVLLPSGQGVIIPPGALLENTTIGVETVPRGLGDQNAQNLQIVSDILRFSPSGLQFLIPVQIVIRLDDNVMNSELAAIYRYNTTAMSWMEKPGSVVTTDNTSSFIVVSTMSFSSYGAFIVSTPASTPGPGGSNITIPGKAEVPGMSIEIWLLAVIAAASTCCIWVCACTVGRCCCARREDPDEDEDASSDGDVENGGAPTGGGEDPISPVVAAT